MSLRSSSNSPVILFEMWAWILATFMPSPHPLCILLKDSSLSYSQLFKSWSISFLGGFLQSSFPTATQSFSTLPFCLWSVYLNCVLSRIPLSSTPHPLALTLSPPTNTFKAQLSPLLVEPFLTCPRSSRAFLRASSPTHTAAAASSSSFSFSSFSFFHFWIPPSASLA